MSPILFYFFAAMTLVFGVALVANRNPVASALCLVISFLGLAALFVGLDAYFIAVVHVLVYAGAVVMVLFLFIIMLLDLKAEERRKPNLIAYGGGGLRRRGVRRAASGWSSNVSRLAMRPFPRFG